MINIKFDQARQINIKFFNGNMSSSNKKVILIGKTQKLGPYLRKKIGANTYFLSYDYFKITTTHCSRDKQYFFDWAYFTSTVEKRGTWSCLWGKHG